MSGTAEGKAEGMDLVFEGEHGMFVHGVLDRITLSRATEKQAMCVIDVLATASTRMATAFEKWAEDNAPKRQPSMVRDMQSMKQEDPAKGFYKSLVKRHLSDTKKCCDPKNVVTSIKMPLYRRMIETAVKNKGEPMQPPMGALNTAGMETVKTAESSVAGNAAGGAIIGAGVGGLAVGTGNMLLDDLRRQARSMAHVVTPERGPQIMDLMRRVGKGKVDDNLGRAMKFYLTARKHPALSVLLPALGLGALSGGSAHLKNTLNKSAARGDMLAKLLATARGSASPHVLRLEKNIRSMIGNTPAADMATAAVRASSKDIPRGIGTFVQPAFGTPYRRLEDVGPAIRNLRAAVSGEAVANRLYASGQDVAKRILGTPPV